MKKYYVLAVCLLLSAPGCFKKSSKSSLKPTKQQKEISSQVDIPLADEIANSLFEEDLGEFSLPDDISAHDIDITYVEGDTAAVANNEYQDQDFGVDENQNFAWVEESVANEKDFDVVYFDFDSYSIKEAEEAKVAADIEKAVKQLNEHKAAGRNAIVVIEGHACNSAGSDTYNLALSEKRAKVLADRFVASGVARDCIKNVGRGKERAAIINGVEVAGSRKAQWANRRDEVRVINA